jgi:uncharacterized membrane protein YphA (DoxX/SURF4 family)
MTDMIDDEINLVARPFLATLFLIFGWRKVRDLSGHGEANDAGWGSNAGIG